MEEQRYGNVGQRLCSATNRAGEPCRAPAMRMQTVCRVHGGSSPQAKAAARRRLLELVDPAITQLTSELEQADLSKDRLKAIEMILDRTGFGKQMTVEVDDVRDMVADRIRSLRDTETES